MSDSEAFDHSGAETATPGDSSIHSMSFEQALAELETIVQKLERGQLDLEASIQAYERGTALRQHCDAKLEAARLRVEKITFDRDGNAKTEPFEES